ncbi:hypothetical protein PUN28_013972 [Cardiocondyla obscurior]|uniref:Uncharacterized protein n=1 Tax=Cardiocondyla obscurior TaxID=286306 RepID=A0AAW2F754_9HYME
MTVRRVSWSPIAAAGRQQKPPRHSVQIKVVRVNGKDTFRDRICLQSTSPPQKFKERSKIYLNSSISSMNSILETGMKKDTENRDPAKRRNCSPPENRPFRVWQRKEEMENEDRSMIKTHFQDNESQR